MRAIIGAAMSRTRTTLVFLALMLLGGIFSYIVIPKEAAPEIDIPIFTVNVTYPGISAEDSGRLLIEPLERRLQSLDGLRTMTGQAGEGFASMTLEFEPGYDQDAALQDVRDEVDLAQADLPAGADEPVVREVDLSVFPILTVALSGTVPERELIRIARELSDDLEATSGVLEASLTGDREDLLEIIVDPLAVQSYGISSQEITQAVQNNNQLVPAGAFDTGAGRIAVSIPGTIQSISDVMAMPVRVEDGIVVRVQDVAEVRQSFQDPTSFARIDGRPTIGIDISKTAAANVIETIDEVQAIVEARRESWPEAIRVDYLQNQADDIRTLLGDLENNVILAVLMVVLPTILALGVRASLLVGIAIPGAFFGGILIITLMGFTLNIVVLFGLILVIGMLVDGAMVVVELAERYRAEGRSPRDAFLDAASRMSWPIIASTATTVAVFLPLLFWPGTAGQFMFYLPATVIVTLTVSMAMALIFVPVIGALSSARRPAEAPEQAAEQAPPQDRKQDEAKVPGFYDRALKRAIGRPGLALAVTSLVLVGSFFAYSVLGQGSAFFPDIEPERAQIQIKANGDLSVYESDRLVRLVEAEVIDEEGLDLIYSRTIGSVEERLASNLAPDVIGTIQVDFLDWRDRAPAAEIIERLRAATAGIPGIGIQVEQQQAGPGAARPVEVEVVSPDSAALAAAAAQLQRLMAQQGTFTDIASDVPVPGVEVRLEIDRQQAARYGVDVATLGSTVRLLTNGVILGSYLPDHLSDEVDITMRYPARDRNFAQLALLRVPTPSGMVPIFNFVDVVAAPSSSVINRVGGENVQTISSGLTAGATVAEELEILQQTIDATDFGEGVEVRIAGEIEDQQETTTFLISAFVVAVFLMFLIMLTQLNSFFQSFLVLSAIICSLPGVFLMLIVRQEPFSLVMGGMGIMALAGVVINNNIILIDSYNEHRANGLGPAEAGYRAGVDRFRPVLLTAITTITSLMPMVLGITLDFFARDAYIGAPSGQFWAQLATTVVGGLAVSTVITMLLTPTLLVWDGNRRERRSEKKSARTHRNAPAAGV